MPSILADLAASQPLGLSSALSALSAMAGALGGTQSGLANQQGPDQITNYLSRMSRHQLLGIVSEIKVSKISSAVLGLCMLVVAIYVRTINVRFGCSFYFGFC